MFNVHKYLGPLPSATILYRQSCALQEAPAEVQLPHPFGLLTTPVAITCGSQGAVIKQFAGDSLPENKLRVYSSSAGCTSSSGVTPAHSALQEAAPEQCAGAAVCGGGGGRPGAAASLRV